MKKQITEVHVQKVVEFFVLIAFAFGILDYCQEKYKQSAILFGIVAGLAVLSQIMTKIARYLTNKKNA
jgi:hypothetical protein